MNHRRAYTFPSAALIVLAIFAALAGGLAPAPSPRVDAVGPAMLSPNLDVRTVVSGLTTPISLAFLGPDDLLVLEKNTGRVKRVVNGAVQGTVLDLAVNFGSERGLLGIALHPDFPTNPGVYLYWTESSTGADTNVLASVPLLGNRVDRFVWNGSGLTFDRNLIKLRALQSDAGQSPRGNHNGGVITFGPDDKLYIVIGDVGRRGWLQNLACGPTTTCPGPAVPDDQFGGPEPDNAHLSGAILRLNPDGSTPSDNPFFGAGAAMGGEVGANLQKLYAYGIRNSFGMAFDPLSGVLWAEENGDDAFDEINRVTPGFNSGWIQVMGPVARVGEFKAIETADQSAGGLQQLRWPPTNLANTQQDALARLFQLPGSHYSDPEFSWKYAVAPAGLGFVNGTGLGAELAGDLIVGAATTSLDGGYLFRFPLAADRQTLAPADPLLADKVADNTDEFDVTESQSLRFGTGFGVATDIRTGPNGNLFVVSLTDGAIYEIFRRPTAATATPTLTPTATATLAVPPGAASKRCGGVTDLGARQKLDCTVTLRDAQIGGTIIADLTTAPNGVKAKCDQKQKPPTGGLVCAKGKEAKSVAKPAVAIACPTGTACEPGATFTLNLKAGRAGGPIVERITIRPPNGPPQELEVSPSGP